jgi:iron(III) transport system substrate-binding protein
MKLIDYLLSPEIEARLAKSASGQIPLNSNVDVELAPAVQPARSATPFPVNFEKAAARWEEAQKFLTAEFHR